MVRSFKSCVLRTIAAAAAAACLLLGNVVAADDQQPPAPQPAELTVAPATEPAGGRPLIIIAAQPTAADPSAAATGDSVPADVYAPAADKSLKQVYTTAYTDAQAPAAALLQANEAHRQAYAEVAVCKNCHGGGAADATRWIQVLTDVNAQQQDLKAARLGVAQQLRKVADAPKIGVTVGPLDDVLRAQLGLPTGKGLVVTEVLPESPAQHGGVEAHDLLININGQPVANEEDFDHRLVAARPDGPPLQLRLIRKGQPVEVTVAPVFPAKKASVRLDASSAATQPAAPRYRIGVQIAPADDTLRDQLSLADTGVVVLDVLPKTPAERQGVRAYDVITKAAGRPVRNERDLMESVQASKDAQLELEYVRAGKRQYLAVAPEVAPPPEPTAAVTAPAGHPRELLLLPREVYGLGEGQVLIAPPGNGASLRLTAPWEGGGAGGSTSEQLERINAEIQQLRASIETLRARTKLEEEQHQLEKKEGQKP